MYIYINFAFSTPLLSNSLNEIIISLYKENRNLPAAYLSDLILLAQCPSLLPMELSVCLFLLSRARQFKISWNFASSSSRSSQPASRYWDPPDRSDAKCQLHAYVRTHGLAYACMHACMQPASRNMRVNEAVFGDRLSVCSCVGLSVCRSTGLPYVHTTYCYISRQLTHS